MKAVSTIFTASCLLSIISPTALCASIDVIVGGPGILRYNPQSVDAKIGDTVRFIFQQKNHTATQSTFLNPCAPVQNGFDSGFVPVADSQTNGFPVAQLNIVDTSPIWVYCRQGNHCQQGMVFAINPAGKFAAFQAAAMGITNNTSSTTTSSTVTTVTTTVTVSGQPLTTTYTSNPSTTTNNVPVTDHKVIVGGPGKFTYDPSNITAQVGDTVTFEFHQKNHTVTSSSFASPCTSTAESLGFDSGFMAVADNATIFPTYTIKINDTKPIWGYCRQSGHCGQGMVFSINAVESGPNNFAAFQAKAIQINSPQATNTGSSANGYRDAGILTLFSVLLGLFLW